MGTAGGGGRRGEGHVKTSHGVWPRPGRAPPPHALPQHSQILFSTGSSLLVDVLPGSPSAKYAKSAANQGKAAPGRQTLLRTAAAGASGADAAASPPSSPSDEGVGGVGDWAAAWPLLRLTRSDNLT